MVSYFKRKYPQSRQTNCGQIILNKNIDVERQQRKFTDKISSNYFTEKTSIIKFPVIKLWDIWAPTAVNKTGR